MFFRFFDRAPISRDRDCYGLAEISKIKSKSRDEIGGVYLISQLELTPPALTSQNSAIATLCVLCGLALHPDSVRCFKQIWKVGNVGKVGKVGKVGRVGKVGKVGKVGWEGLIMPTWNQLGLLVRCGILAISWQDFLSMLAPYLA